MLGNLKEKAGELQAAGAGAVESAKNAGGGVQEKIKEILAEFNDAIPAIKEIGYTVNEVEIELGLPPKIIPHFNKENDVDQETIDSVIDKYKDKKITSLVLSSLSKAASLQDGVHIGALKFAEVEIEIGVVPTVKIKFQ